VTLKPIALKLVFLSGASLSLCRSSREARGGTGRQPASALQLGAWCTLPLTNRAAAPVFACSIADELFVSFENLVNLADRRGVPYDRWGGGCGACACWKRHLKPAFWASFAQLQRPPPGLLRHSTFFLLPAVATSAAMLTLRLFHPFVPTPPHSPLAPLLFHPCIPTPPHSSHTSRCLQDHPGEQRRCGAAEHPGPVQRRHRRRAPHHQARLPRLPGHRCAALRCAALCHAVPCCATRCCALPCCYSCVVASCLPHPTPPPQIPVPPAHPALMHIHVSPLPLATLL
jgi:hypothetical protein